MTATAHVRVTDTSLRDGSHHLRHQVSGGFVTLLVAALDQARVPVIEVSHGDGLGGASLTYGRSLVDERELIALAVEAATNAKIACLLLPGVGTCDDIRAAADLGASIVRVATHCTEADIASQHFGVARKLGLETVGFLMMSHTQPADVLARQARVMADAGCECVYVVDSAGAMVLDEVGDRVAAVAAAVDGDATVGFHGHENLALGVGNSIVAVRAGAAQIDGSVRRLGAGAGNTPTEAFVAAAAKVGIETGIDPLELFDVAEDVVGPALDEAPSLSRLALVMGYAGVYSSFLKHAYRVGTQYEVSAAEILMRCGRRRLVGGQEDQIIEIAAELAAEQAGDAA